MLKPIVMYSMGRGLDPGLLQSFGCGNCKSKWDSSSYDPSCRVEGKTTNQPIVFVVCFAQEKLKFVFYVKTDVSPFLSECQNMQARVIVLVHHISCHSVL